jgi:hypothetical protein
MADQSFQSLIEVLQQMPTIRNLPGSRSAIGYPFSILGRAISSNDVNARVITKPVR